MSFGIEGTNQEHWSETNYKIAVGKLQQEKPTFGDEGNTKEADGKFYAMGFEVTKDQYNSFLEKIHTVYGELLSQKEDDWKQAA